MTHNSEATLHEQTRKWRPKLTLLSLQTQSLTALVEGMKILCIKDHVRFSINEKITNPSFAFELKKKEKEDDEQLAFIQFSENQCSCIFYFV